MFVFLFSTQWTKAPIFQIRPITPPIDIPQEFPIWGFTSLAFPLWLTDVTIHYMCTQAKKKKQKNPATHHGTTEPNKACCWSRTKKQSKGSRSISGSDFFFFFFVFLRFSSEFSFCGVYAGWIPKRKQSWVWDKLRRSQSPPQRQRVAARMTGKEAGREAATRSSLIDTASWGKEFQMGGITGSIVWLAGTL